MNRTLSVQKVLFKIFLFLFTLNMSFYVLPGDLVQSYGLLGEVSSYISVENQDSFIQSNPIKYKSDNQYRAYHNNIQQRTQYLLLITILLLYFYYQRYLPTIHKHITPIILKVRMNH